MSRLDRLGRQVCATLIALGMPAAVVASPVPAAADDEVSAVGVSRYFIEDWDIYFELPAGIDSEEIGLSTSQGATGTTVSISSSVLPDLIDGETCPDADDGVLARITRLDESSDEAVTIGDASYELEEPGVEEKCFDDKAAATYFGDDVSDALKQSLADQADEVPSSWDEFTDEPGGIAVGPVILGGAGIVAIGAAGVLLLLHRRTRTAAR